MQHLRWCCVVQRLRLCSVAQQLRLYSMLCASMCTVGGHLCRLALAQHAWLCAVRQRRYLLTLAQHARFCVVEQQHRTLTLAQHAVLVQSVHLHTVVQGILIYTRVQGNWLPMSFSTSSLDRHGSSLILIALVSLPSSLGAHCGSAPSSLSLPWFTLGWTHQCRLPAVSHGMS